MHETTREFGKYPVTSVTTESQDMALIDFEDQTSITVSTTHKFLMDNGDWKQVFEIRADDCIKGIDTDKRVSSLRSIGSGPAVKITIDDAHTYVADGLISHNVKKQYYMTPVYYTGSGEWDLSNFGHGVRWPTLNSQF